MRDGKRLVADIYKPEGSAAPLATILIRTPYSRKALRAEGEGARSPATFFARHGYAVVVQDVRGKYDSEGDFSFAGNDGADGYDTIEWIASRPWSNGRVGTFGCSFRGEVQIAAALENPPSLSAMIPQGAGAMVGSADARYNNWASRVGGAFALATQAGWFHESGSGVYMQYPDELPRDVLLQLDERENTEPDYDRERSDIMAALESLPLVDIPDHLNSLPNQFGEILTRPLDDPWWAAAGFVNDESAVSAPSLHVNSWYDYGVNETILQWSLFSQNGSSEIAKANQYLLISPSTHCMSERSARENALVGDREVGDTRFGYWNLYRAWFDRWLRADGDALDDVPRVQYFMMGTNRWRSAEVWPPRGAMNVDYYLESTDGANSLNGDGTLSPARPTSSGSDEYTYDPSTPVPSIGGSVCCTGTDRFQPGAYDQRSVEMRNDVLVYSTSALEKPVAVAGPVQLVLFVSSSAPDTDFTAKLVDVYPDGRAFNVQNGIVRMRYRDKPNPSEDLEEGKVYEISISLNATANTFGKGHRIRIEVSSSNFPAFDRNLNTGADMAFAEDWRAARNKVYFGPSTPSRLILSVISSEQAREGPKSRRP